jgi:hypothetical protein
MALDWTKCAAVESVPGKVSGAWVFRNRSPRYWTLPHGVLKLRFAVNP